jgi:hypothetical protein
MSILPIPSKPQDVKVDWADVELRLKTGLPDDYKKFVQTYGSGRIDDMLFVLNPVTVNKALSLFDAGMARIRALHVMRESDAKRGRIWSYAIFPEPGGLLPWACTDNGDVCLWKTSAADPNKWTVVVYGRAFDTWEPFDGTMTQFLDALLSRKYVSRSLTDDDFPPAEHVFEPYYPN